VTDRQGTAIVMQSQHHTSCDGILFQEAKEAYQCMALLYPGGLRANRHRVMMQNSFCISNMLSMSRSPAPSESWTHILHLSKICIA